VFAIGALGGRRVGSISKVLFAGFQGVCLSGTMPRGLALGKAPPWGMRDRDAVTRRDGAAMGTTGCCLTCVFVAGFDHLLGFCVGTRGMDCKRVTPVRPASGWTSGLWSILAGGDEKFMAKLICAVR
jgi:hypothetical protein